MPGDNPMNIILPAVSTDGPAIERITGNIPSFTPEERDCVFELWGDFLENREHCPYSFCVCKDQETSRILGFACYGKHALTRSTYDLYWLAVDPTAQRSGVGSALLGFVEKQVAAANGSRLIIETSSTPLFSTARKFYKHHHYHQEALLQDFYAPGDHLIIFTKQLRGPYGENQPIYLQTGLQKTPG